MSVDRDERRGRAASFAGVADAYERSRPGYPKDAVCWLAGEKPCDVVDLGAGTGKLTRSLVALGHRVTAVEPLPEMLSRLRVAVPGVTAVEGGAEAIPLASASADVVTVAQAFHWFDHATALREIARVLRPGGRISLIWNVRDGSEEWVAELSDVMVGRTGVDAGAAEPIDASGLFGPVEQAVFGPHVQEIGGATLQELVLSRSYCAVLSDEERAPVLQRVDAVFAAHARNGVVRLPYLAECFRAVRLSQRASARTSGGSSQS
jgi:SAM-dependent methyltransferase